MSHKYSTSFKLLTLFLSAIYFRERVLPVIYKKTFAAIIQNLSRFNFKVPGDTHVCLR